MKSDVEITGIGGSKVKSTRETTVILKRGKFKIKITALVLKNICGGSVDYKAPDSRKPVARRIDLLLESTETFKVLNLNQDDQQQFEVETLLGKCVVGTATNGVYAAQRSAIANATSTKDLDVMLKWFFSLENIGVTTTDLEEHSYADLEAEKLLLQGMSYNAATKTYTLPFLWRPDVRRPSGNRAQAEKRMKQIERKLSNNKGLRRPYQEYFDLLFEKGWARWLTDEEANDPNRYFVPHNIVLKPGHESTPERIVWDFSAVSPNGFSLNDSLYGGPNNIPEMTARVNRFRWNKIAVLADISKMFSMFENDEEAKRYTNFVWRDDPDKPFRYGVLNRVAFGVKESPYKTTQTIKIHAEKFRGKYPETVDCLQQAIYVDDLVESLPTIEEANKLFTEARAILDEASLNLKKWVSNSQEFLALIPEELRGRRANMLLTSNINMDPTHADTPLQTALGLQWDLEEDVLTFVGSKYLINIFEKLDKVTKRGTASIAARLFDSQGFLAPYASTAKQILHQIWLSETKWDESIDKVLEQKLAKWIEDMKNLDKVKIPRWLFDDKKIIDVSIWTFGDASTTCLGMCVYIVALYEDCSVSIRLIMAKSKVVRKDQHSINRKELIAAVLASRLAMTVAEQMKIDKKKVLAFSDSTTVIAWLGGDPTKYKTFVHNRVKIVNEMIPAAKWQYVKGLENPADMPSRGVTIETMMNSNWFDLSDQYDSLRSHEAPEVNLEEVEAEAKKAVKSCLTVEETLAKEAWDDILNRVKTISDYRQFLIVTAVMLRMAKKKKERPKSLNFSQEEFENARKFWIRERQKEVFEEEYDDLVDKGKIEESSKIRKLDPFMDKEGIIRMRGRLDNAPVHYDERHPIILPGFHVKKLDDVYENIESRLVYQEHIDNLHCGIKQTINYLRSRYWIINARNSVKSIIDKCFECQWAMGRQCQAKMAELPEDRLHLGEPWTYAGIDFFGPYYVTETRRKGKNKDQTPFKIWVLLFTDMTSRAVHFETTETMDADAVVAAIRKAMALLGVFKKIRSDEARQFLAAKRQLEKLQRGLDKDKIEFETNVPKGQHRGGCWERMVKSTKEILRKILGRRLVDKETFEVCLRETSALMNDRPLSKGEVTSKEEFRVITPSMLTSGRRLRQLADWKTVPKDEDDQNFRALWRDRQTLINHIWNRFRKEYVAFCLPRIDKWQKEHINLKEGDLVLVGDTDVSDRGKWPVAIVESVEETRSFKRDGQVRTVLVRTPEGRRLRRPVQKLVRLPD